MSGAKFNQSASPPVDTGGGGGQQSFVDGAAGATQFSLRPFDPISFNMTGSDPSEHAASGSNNFGLAGVMGISQSQRKKSKSKSNNKNKRHSILSATGITLAALTSHGHSSHNNNSNNSNNNAPVTIVPRHSHQSSYPGMNSTSPINMDAYDLSMSPQQQMMMRNGEVVDGAGMETNMITRNVIIRKEANGYGITISGDNPVFIQTVKPNSAAYNAGARANDRIIKINGTLVTKLDHTAVVKMLKDCDSYVALTLASQREPNLTPLVAGGATSPVHSPVPPVVILPNAATQQPSSPPISYHHHQPQQQHSLHNIPSTILAYPLEVGGGGNAQITNPAPATEQTQLIFLNGQLKMVEDMITKQTTELNTLRVTSSGTTSEIEKKEGVIQKLVNKMEELRAKKEAVIQSTASAVGGNTNEAMRTMLTLDSDFEDDDEGAVTTGICRDDTKQSFDDDLTSSTTKLFPRGSGQSKRSSNRFKRESKMLAERLTIENILVHSLRLARYLIQSNRPPHALLFYTVAKHVFPGMVQTLFTSGNSLVARSIIQRWAYQIVATWLVKDSPLFFHDYDIEYLTNFDRTLATFVSSTMTSNSLVSSLFEPFLEKAREIVQEQLSEFKAATVGRREWLLSSCRDDLQASIEMLLAPATGSGGTLANNTGIFGKVEIRDIDIVLDQVIAHTQPNTVSTVAVSSSLMTIAHFQSDVNSRHVLLSDQNLFGNTASIVSAPFTIVANSFSSTSSLNPVLKLSDSSSNSKKSNHKRMSSIPSGSNSRSSSSIFDASGSSASDKMANKNAIQELGHTFLPVVEMTRVLECNGCMLPLWGEYNQRCSKCSLFTHVWCRKSTASTTLCSSTSAEVSNSNSGLNSNSGRKSRSGALKDKKNSVFGRLGISGTVFKHQIGDQNNNNNNHISKSSTSIDSSTDSSDSSTDESDDENNIANALRVGDDPKARLLNNSHIQSNKNFNDNRSSTIAISSSMVHQAQAVNAAAAAAAAANQGPVNRSGSFNQRKKSKSLVGALNPRKRSDPALMTQGGNVIHFGSIGGNSELSNATKLTSAQSSGALLSYNNNESGNGRVGKPMTASDSSLVSKSSPLSVIPSGGRRSETSDSFSSHNKDQQPQQSKEQEGAEGPSESPVGGADSNTVAGDNGLTSPLVSSQEKTEQNDNSSSSPPPPPPPPPPMWRHRGPTAAELGIAPGLPPPLPPRVTEKRRAILQEILDNQWTYLEMLKYARNVYQKSLKDLGKDNPFSREEMRTIFGNLRQLKRVNRQVYKRLKAAHDLSTKGSGVVSTSCCLMEETLEEIFCGDLGRAIETETGAFCLTHKASIELWNAKKKDPRLRYLQDTELKKKTMPNCPFYKMTLHDLLGACFQRTMRYSLLLERLLKDTKEASGKEGKAYRHVEAALAQSKLISQYINSLMDKAEERARLQEILKKTDDSSYRVPGLLDSVGTKHELIHMGSLQLRFPKSKPIELWLVLTDQLLLVLTKESKSSDSNKDERYYLKAHNHPFNKKAFRPDIKFDDLLVRNVATDMNGFFVFSNKQDLMYEFSASSPAEQQKWIGLITNAIDAYNRKMGNPVSSTTLLQRSYTTVGVQPSKSIDLSNKSDSSTSVADIQRRPLPPPPTTTDEQQQPKATSPQLQPQQQAPPPAPTPAEEEESENKEKQLPGNGPTRFVGIIKNVPPTPLVPFSNVSVSNESAFVRQATIQEMSDEQQENLKVYLNDQKQEQENKIFVADVKAEINNLLMLCDIAEYDTQNDIRDLKCRIAYELFKKAMNIVSPLTNEQSGNGLTEEDSIQTNFEQLQTQLDLFMKKLVQTNTTPSIEPAGGTLKNIDNDDGYIEVNNTSEQQQALNKRSKRSTRSDSNVSKKSEFDDLECLFEELVDQQISEFENTTTTGNNDTVTKEEEQLEMKIQENKSSVVPNFVDMSSPSEPIYDDPEEEQLEPLSNKDHSFLSEVVESTTPSLVAETESVSATLPDMSTTIVSQQSDENALELQNNLSTLPLTGTTVAKTETYMI